MRGNNIRKEYDGLLTLEHIFLRGTETSLTARLDVEYLRVKSGEHMVILGPNGSGKSSLLQIICRMVWPEIREGMPRPVLHMNGTEPMNLWQMRKTLGVLSPAVAETMQVEGDISAEEAVIASLFGAYRLYPHHDVTMDDRQKAQQALVQADAETLAGRQIQALSTGELRRVLIARMLVHAPTLLLLDEPTIGLDPVAAARLLQTLERLATQQVTLVMVTHHVEEILPCTQRVVLMKEGRIWQEGSPETMLTAERLSALYGAACQPCHVEGQWRLQVLPLTPAAEV